MNPLLTDFDTPYNTVPFSDIKEEYYKDAFAKAIKEVRREIDDITDQSQEPTFENTAEAMDKSGDRLDRISSVLFNLNSAETTPGIQKITQEISPELSKLGNDITLNKVLYKRVKALWDQREDLSLNEEQFTLLERQYLRFVRNGAALSGDDQEKLRKMDQELSKLSLNFGENLLAATQDYELHVVDPEKLSGLPDSAMEAANDLARDREKEGYIFTLDYPSYKPFMTYCDNRELREKMHRAYGSRAYKGKHDNTDILLRISKLRYERARLLGYDSHAHYVLERRMALTPEKVNGFLSDITDKAKPAAERQFKNMGEFAKSDSVPENQRIGKLQKWDGAYYGEKLKQEKFQLDDEKLKPYFKLENVIDGAFQVAGKLYGLQFTETDEIDKYHEEVRTFKVTDENDNLTAIFYADFFPRSGKRNGAWMTVYKPQFKENGKDHRPHISIVCNFTRPTSTRPSLLTFNEVTTLFHEFGHALHGMLADTKYRSLSGTSVHWDFVELPSQILENWCYRKEALELFAHHYKNGDLLPDEYIKRIQDAANFQEGLQTMRQVSFAMLDMSWHNDQVMEITDIENHEQEVFAQTDLFPQVNGTCFSPGFAHIFQGGYAAGYYSYKWAEVLDADAFEAFKENGIFDRKTATSFRENILSKGGTVSPMELYKRFRGSEPKIDSLLKRAGLEAK